MKHRSLCAVLAAVSLTSCGDDAATPTPAAAIRTCGVSAASTTPVDRARFPLGATFWLPSGTTWTLASAPQGNQNALFADAPSRRQGFVPHSAGAHRFTGADGRTVTMTAVAPSAASFRNHNYFPSRAVAADGERLWVAAVLRPEVIEVNRATLAPVRSIAVGGWPVAVAVASSRNQLVVAAKADDSLTIVDVATGRAVRSVWVGDEVSNVVVTPDGVTAIATVATDRKAVFVDLATATVVGSVDVGIDPTLLALRADGQRVWVAGRRTGNPTENAATDPSGNDLTEIDVARRAVTRTVRNVGATLGGLALSDDGARLYVAGVRSDNMASLADEMGGAFRHVVIEYDVSADAVRELRAQDVTRYPTGMGPVEVGPRDLPGGDRELMLRRMVSLQSVAVVGTELWVLSEASDMVVRLSRETLAELGRQEVVGRPRAMVVHDGRAYAYGHQALTVTEVPMTGMARRSMALAADPRPAEVAAGQRFFTGTGVRVPMTTSTIAGDMWSCNSCHADALSDRIVWQAGPSRMHRNASRPFTQLEGTWPLGWQGYLSDVRNYAYTVTTNIGIYQPSQAQVDGLTAYLASLAPPPAANSLTERDGGHSAEACAGAAVYQRACASCHGGPMTTTRARIDESIGDGLRADTPSLIGSYRNGTWFRKNNATSLADAVSQMAVWLRRSLTPAELASLTRYVSELTGRDFYLLTEAPRRTLPLPARGPVALVFSMPVLATPDNLARVRMVTAAGQRVAARVEANGRAVTLTPEADLPFGAMVRVEVAPGFEAESETRVAEPIRVEYSTVERPALRVDGTYRVDLRLPPLPGATMPGAGLFVEFTARSEATGTVPIEVRYVTSQYRFRATAILSGRRIIVPPMPVPVGIATADNFTGFTGDLTDSDNDGVADGATPTGGFTLSGPGFEFPEVGWTMRRM
jgi:DNA-binding beta-propeller fold protein YncE